jgi:hypothetical protein
MAALFSEAAEKKHRFGVGLYGGLRPLWPEVSVKEVLNVPNRNVRFAPETGHFVCHKKTPPKRGDEMLVSDRLTRAFDPHENFFASSADGVRQGNLRHVG